MKKLLKEAYIRYRLEKADETLKAAKILYNNELWNSMVNRLYYASFYAVTALLLKNGISSKSHAGVKTQFFLHFIKTGKMSKELGKHYSDLFDGRQKGDYNDFYDFDKDSAHQLYNKSIELMDKIHQLMQ